MELGAYYILKRYSKANNNCLASWDQEQETKHITYLGAKNLNGHAMSKLLPSGDLSRLILQSLI